MNKSGKLNATLLPVIMFAIYFFISADEDKIHVGGDTKTSITAEFAFKLIPEVG